MLKWFKKKLGFESAEVPVAEPVVDPAVEPVDAGSPEIELVVETKEAPAPLIEKTTADLTALATAQGAYKLQPPVGFEAGDSEQPAAEIEAQLPDETAVLETFETAREQIAAQAVEEVEQQVEQTEVKVPEDVAAEPKRGWFGRLRDRLSKTKSTLVDAVRSAVRLRGKVDEELLEEIEEILIQSDVGVVTTAKIVERMRKEGRKQGTLDGDALMELFKGSIEEILKEGNRELDLKLARPMILLIVGVNGTGKTTTIGKIAQTLAGQGKLVMMVAADTFRAAAAEQLTIWAERTGSCIVRQKEGADPAAVVYEALEGAKAGPTPDVILIDTAGRLHTKVNLMEELKKIVRVIAKFYPEGPHETILVLDATTGQNAVNQVKIFHEACALTGLIMTKLDGTAKGGILIACKDLYQLPIFKIGIGEGAEDLRDFDPRDFAEALFSVETQA